MNGFFCLPFAFYIDSLVTKKVRQVVQRHTERKRQSEQTTSPAASGLMLAGPRCLNLRESSGESSWSSARWQGGRAKRAHVAVYNVRPVGERSRGRGTSARKVPNCSRCW